MEKSQEGMSKMPCFGICNQKKACVCNRSAKMAFCCKAISHPFSSKKQIFQMEQGRGHYAVSNGAFFFLKAPQEYLKHAIVRRVLKTPSHSFFP